MEVNGQYETIGPQGVGGPRSAQIDAAVSRPIMNKVYGTDVPGRVCC